MITIDLNTDAISTALAGLVGQLGNMTPVMNEIGEHLMKTTTDRFTSGLGPDGTAWAARSAVTLAIYARHKPPKVPGVKPLTVTRNLFNSIHHDYGPNFAEVSANTPYAAVMQFGAVKGSLGAYWFTNAHGTAVEGSSPWGNIPARPFIGISGQDEADILDIISEALERAVQA